MAYWNISFNIGIDENNPELIKLITSIYNYRDIFKDIPVGDSIKFKFIKAGVKSHPVLEGTIKDISLLNDIKGTTAIEGNTLGDEDVDRVLNTSNPKSIQEKEIYNMKKVRDFIEEYSKHENTENITLQLIKNIHAIVLKDIEETDITAGKFRLHDVVVGANFKPPNFEDVPDIMNKFIHYINSTDIIRLDPLVRAIAAHFYLVTIHPFGDGNGRTSRALESYLFYCNNMEVHGFYSLNDFYYRNYKEYFEILDSTRFKHKGNLTEFAIFSLSGYLSELKKIGEQIKSFTLAKGYQNYVLELLNYDQITSRQHLIVDFISRNNGEYTKAQLLKLEDPIFRSFYNKIKSPRTIDRDIVNLCNKELICENSEKKIEINIKVMQRFM